MAVLVSRNCFSLLVVFLLFAAYPSTVRSKPTGSSLLDKENVDYDLETAASTEKAGRFFHEFNKPPHDEFKTTTKPVPTKPSKGHNEGTTEKVKIAKTSEELDSKFAGEKKSAGKKEKAKVTEMDSPSEYDSSESQEFVDSWDDAMKASKKSTENQDNSAEDSRKSAKENDISPEKKSKTRKPTTDQPESEPAERLPSAERQKSLTTTTTTTPFPDTTPASKPTTGAATSTSWSRALVSLAVTVSTVFVLL